MVGDWEILKAAHESAYKKTPLDIHDQGAAIIAVRNPHDKPRCCFASRSLVSGSIPAVVRYSAFSRLIIDLVNHLFGNPLVSLFDYFASITKRLLADSALATFAEFCSLLRINLKETKSEAGPDITLLGLRSYFPASSNRSGPSSRSGETKRTASISQWIISSRRNPPPARSSQN